MPASRAKTMIARRRDGHARARRTVRDETDWTARDRIDCTRRTRTRRQGQARARTRRRTRTRRRDGRARAKSKTETDTETDANMKMKTAHGRRIGPKTWETLNSGFVSAAFGFSFQLHSVFVSVSHSVFTSICIQRYAPLPCTACIRNSRRFQVQHAFETRSSQQQAYIRDASTSRQHTVRDAFAHRSSRQSRRDRPAFSSFFV